MEEKNTGKGSIAWRLRDWGISRQRYWGCPIPIIYCQTCGQVPVPREDLPVVLPEDIHFDQPGNPLDHHPTWKHTTCPKCGAPPSEKRILWIPFFESSWYFIRYINPFSMDKGIDKEATNQWLPVDQYIGGVEHAVLHLLYARFLQRSLQTVATFLFENHLSDY